MPPNYVQRMRLLYRKFGPTRFIGHLDMARTWERALNRTDIPVAYSQGFNRRPRMQFAAPLPLGYTSDVELVDIWLGEIRQPAQVLEEVRAKMAPGIDLVSAEIVPLNQPSLPSLVVESTYQVTFLALTWTAAELRRQVQAFLAAEAVWRHRQDKAYDLRPLVLEATVPVGDSAENPPTLSVRLIVSPQKTGRPDEFVAALGLDPLDARFHRIALALDKSALA